MKSYVQRVKQHVRSIRNPTLQRGLDAWLDARYQSTEWGKYRRWLRSGSPIPPPPFYKQFVVRGMGHDFGIDILIETGTFEGSMIRSVQHDFHAIYSVELDPDLYLAASARFARFDHVTLLRGDSAAVLKDLLPHVLKPCVFWLDAHFSGGSTTRGDKESPIAEELMAIEGHGRRRDDVILIDDAREFGAGDYPAIAWVQSWARDQGYDRFDIDHDIIRIYCTRAGKARDVAL